jgi:hypothetical protein
VDNTSSVTNPIIDDGKEHTIWSGESRGAKILWTTKDIYISNGHTSYKFFSNYVKGLYERNYKYERRYSKTGTSFKGKMFGKTPDCPEWTDGEIVSIVGPMMFLEVETFLGCGIMQYHKHWVVVDLLHPSNIKWYADTKEDQDFTGYGVKLSDFFSDAEILNGLLQTDHVKEAIALIDPEFRPKTVAELINWFQKKYDESMAPEPVVKKWDFTDLEVDNTGRLSARLYTGFVFDKVDHDALVVRVGLYPVHKSHEVANIEIKLPIPGKIRTDIIAAQGKQNGYLYVDFQDRTLFDCSRLDFDDLN